MLQCGRKVAERPGRIYGEAESRLRASICTRQLWAGSLTQDPLTTGFLIPAMGPEALTLFDMWLFQFQAALKEKKKRKEVPYAALWIKKKKKKKHIYGPAQLTVFVSFQPQAAPEAVAKPSTEPKSPTHSGANLPWHKQNPGWRWELNHRAKSRGESYCLLLYFNRSSSDTSRDCCP